MILHVHKERVADLIWTKLLKIMFLIERARRESWVELCERFEDFVGWVTLPKRSGRCVFIFSLDSMAKRLSNNFIVCIAGNSLICRIRCRIVESNVFF